MVSDENSTIVSFSEPEPREASSVDSGELSPGEIGDSQGKETVQKSPGQKSATEEVKRMSLQAIPPIDENIKIKIVDLGNGCWLDNHFSTEIQTR
jgi:hypothetical protein